MKLNIIDTLLNYDSYLSDLVEHSPQTASS